MSTRQQRRQAQRARARSPRTRFHPALVLTGIVGAIAIVVAVLVVSTGESDDASQAAGGPALPNLTLTGFDDSTISLAAYRGKPLVINFWASWCVPCLAEMPGFERVYQRRKADVEFLGVNLQDDPEAAQAVIGQTGITYPVARDIDGSAFVALQAYGMPTTIFVSAAGEMLELHTGEITAPDLEARIDSLFGL